MNEGRYTYTETSPWVNKIARLPFPIGTMFFLATSKVAREVFKRIIVDRSTDTALHPIYDYSIDKTGYSKWDHRWQSSKAAQSLRFRYRWINDKLAQLLASPQANQHGVVQVISLGSGTGLAFINALKNLNLASSRLVVNFVDIDARAITRAFNLANKHELLKHINFINETSTNALDRFGPNNVFLIELVGIVEYVDDSWLKNEFKKIYSTLQPGGYFIGAAISSDEESDFAHKVLHWPAMTYRTEKNLKRLFLGAGFSDIEFIDCGIFKSWIARK